MLYVKPAEVSEAWSRHVEIHDGDTHYYCYLWANEDSEYIPRFRITRISIHKLHIWINDGAHSYATIHGYTKDQILSWKECDFMKIVELILAHCEDAYIDIDMDKFLW